MIIFDFYFDFTNKARIIWLIFCYFVVKWEMSEFSTFLENRKIKIQIDL